MNAATIKCPCCAKTILEGNVLTVRVVILGADGSRAKCPRCKTMVKVPVQFAQAVPRGALRA